MKYVKIFFITPALVIMFMLCLFSESRYSRFTEKIDGPEFKKGSKKIVYVQKTPARSGHTIDETTSLLRNRRLGKIRLDHDDHVYKCMKISREGKDLQGAVDALIAAKTRLGDTLDNDEVDLIIKISKTDTGLYREIIMTARKIGKKKYTVKENLMVANLLLNGKGVPLLKGIETARSCRYRMENDYFTWDRASFFIKLGKITNVERLLNIYSAMKRVGMSRSINTSTLNILYKLYSLNGDVEGTILSYLKRNKWKSRNQPGQREYKVIRDLMNSDYAASTPDSEKKYKSSSINVRKSAVRSKKSKKRKYRRQYNTNTVARKNCYYRCK